MHIQLTQMQRSVLALVMVGLFLITGKLFVWKKPAEPPVIPQQSEPPVTQESDLPAVTTEPPAETAPPESVTETSPTVLVPIEPHVEESTPESSDAAGTVSSQTDTALSQTTSSETQTVSSTVTDAETTAPAAESSESAAASDYFSDALFIGDSRTVGMALYAPIDGATYFATVGLSTYKIDAVTSEVPGTKGQTFTQVLGAKAYSKIYIMLGINELGNDFNYTMEHYRALIQRVQQAHPNAIVVLQANLHVAYSRSSTDAVVNNTVINNFNNELAGMADSRKIFYLDANPLFDDETGSLAADYTSDGTHPYAKHYLTWADWLKTHTIPV